MYDGNQQTENTIVYFVKKISTKLRIVVSHSKQRKFT